jgi:L-iditol 2-dehydrogenase
VAIHTVDLAKIRVGHRVAILGAGPIGLCILQLVRLAGADAVFVTDRFPWRVELAKRFGATAAWCCGEKGTGPICRDGPAGASHKLDLSPFPETPVARDPAAAVREATAGRGVDVAIEAAWCDQSVDQAADMLLHGGRLLVVGVPEVDRLLLKHSTARRKGLTIVMVRRMKRAYPRAIRLVERGAVDLSPLVSHRFPLARAAEAFALNADYRDGVVKVIVDA